jgi:hypothetical protein
VRASDDTPDGDAGEPEELCAHTLDQLSKRVAWLGLGASLVVGLVALTVLVTVAFVVYAAAMRAAGTSRAYARAGLGLAG